MPSYKIEGLTLYTPSRNDRPLFCGYKDQYSEEDIRRINEKFHAAIQADYDQIQSQKKFDERLRKNLLKRRRKERHEWEREKNAYYKCMHIIDQLKWIRRTLPK